MELNRDEIVQLSKTSTMALANKMAAICLTGLDGFLTLAYIAEGAKGNRSLGYVALVVALALIPVIASWICYSKNPETGMVKHIVGIGFAILYAVIILTGINPLVFIYAFPMLVVVTLYLDKAYLVQTGVGVIILNIIDVVRKSMAGSVGGELMQIQIVVTVMIVIYIIITVSVSLKYQEINAARITLEKDKTTDVLNKILSVSGTMTSDIVKVVGEMKELSLSVDDTLTAMSEVQAGASETANSVQDQLLQTEEINNYAGAVEEAAGIIKSNLGYTIEAIDEGKKCMQEMTKLSQDSVTASKSVTEALDGFKVAADQMNQITDLINSIAKQTSLLALNASIEAARAGDAGKGFAVVAMEISGLSGQTTEATKNISELIKGISSQLNDMIDAISEMIKGNELQSEAASRTDDAFVTIVNSIDAISGQADVLVKSIDELAEANKAIVETVTTISAISEQVAAHSNRTYESSKLNQAIVQTVGELVDSLNDGAQELSNTSDS